MLLLLANTVYYSSLRDTSTKIGRKGTAGGYLLLHFFLVWFDYQYLIFSGLNSLFISCDSYSFDDDSCAYLLVTAQMDFLLPTHTRTIHALLVFFCSMIIRISRILIIIFIKDISSMYVSTASTLLIDTLYKLIFSK